jgi:hypothetical protein
MAKFRIFSIFILVFFLLSCNNDDEINPDYEIPGTYNFKDDAGNNTVDFSGQTTRLNQLQEMTTYMKTANTPGTALSQAQLLEMYSNKDGDGSSLFSESARNPGKQLRDKTARGNSVYQEKFENLLIELAAVSGTTLTDQYNASPGTAGVIRSGDKKYLVGPKGEEYAQLIEKGLMGAIFYDQIQNVYLGVEKLNVDNETAVEPENGKFYTIMEHHWDEAFGYFTSATDFPATGTDRFWGKYSNTVDGSLDSNSKIMNAFLKGRAAISNKDYNTRDEQVRLIRQELEKVAAATSIHYLNGAISNFADDAVRNHELSEAVAFIESLFFTSQETAMITGSELEDVLGHLEDNEGDYNFYSVEPADLQAARDKLAGYAGLENIKTVL